MRRSAVLRDVPHAELESRLGNYLETGWTITSAYPTSERIDTMNTQSADNLHVGFRSVTHWTIFLETEFDYVLVNGPV